MANPTDPLASVRCGATLSSGQQCKQWVPPHMKRCRFHGGGTPQALAKARRRMEILREPAMERIYQLLVHRPDCPHCGRSDSDRDPVVVRAALGVLDRSGFGPRINLSWDDGRESDYQKLSDDELAMRADAIAMTLRNRREEEETPTYVPDAIPGDGPSIDDQIPAPGTLIERKGERAPNVTDFPVRPQVDDDDDDDEGGDDDSA